MMAKEQGFAVVFLILLSVLGKYIASAECEIPAYLRGEYYAFQDGMNVHFLINTNEIHTGDNIGNCNEIEIKTDSNAQPLYTSVQLYEADTDCYVCWQIYQRTPNVLQVKKNTCYAPPGNAVPSLSATCNDIEPGTEFLTMFRVYPVSVDCKPTFDAAYEFTYETDMGGGSTCTGDSRISACQVPGFQYQLVRMVFAKCPGSSDEETNILFQCLGSWEAPGGGVYSAFMDLDEDVLRNRFRCMITQREQNDDGAQLYDLSRYADCTELNNEDVPFQLAVKTALARPEVQDPTCELPSALTGTWFSEDSSRMDVYITKTHLYSISGYEEELLTCTTRVGDRYLMSVRPAGNCDALYACVDLTLRGDNFVDMMRSRSYVLTPGELEPGSRLICNSQSVPYRSNDTEWEELTFISTSPTPVDCPIKGRYELIQHGADTEKYKVANRDGSNEEVASLLESCQDNPGKLIISKADQVTANGTNPENQTSTRELTCVGDWSQDGRLHMVTYDELDTDSEFRCWVYAHVTGARVMISKATGAVCGPDQTAHSHAHLPEVSLHVVLNEDAETGPCWEKPPNVGRSSVLQSFPVVILGFALLVTGGNWCR